MSASDTDPIDRKFLETLVCPVTRGVLVLDREKGELVSRNAGLAYPIQAGVPVMLVDMARKID